jgi:hypothetical protein
MSETFKQVATEVLTKTLRAGGDRQKADVAVDATRDLIQ